ncbi:MAG: oligopeptide/dipeptide ABC transporter ATP-binding protein [Caldimonas sp.]
MNTTVSAARGEPVAAHAVPLLSAHGLGRRFEVTGGARALLTRRPRHFLQALRDVSLELAPGETLGIVGESGCGKSTLARCLSGLDTPDEGSIRWQGQPMATGSTPLQRARRVQMVFQDPYASLNPRMSLAQTLDEVLHVHALATTRGERADRVDELLLTVGLAPRLKHHLPHALSGGQRQRISIARALAVGPQVLIADEPVSALDASIQAQIINLLEKLSERLGIAFVFISHDLNVVRHISDRIAVMYLGQIVECATTEALFESPTHPYTRALLAAIPQTDPSRRSLVPALAGELPDPTAPPHGCSFSTRCPWVVGPCRAQEPALLEQTPGHVVRCSNAAARTAHTLGPIAA